jgi:hypothetical protein
MVGRIDAAEEQSTTGPPLRCLALIAKTVLAAVGQRFGSAAGEVDHASTTPISGWHLLLLATGTCPDMWRAQATIGQ